MERVIFTIRRLIVLSSIHPSSIAIIGDQEDGTPVVVVVHHIYPKAYYTSGITPDTEDAHRRRFSQHQYLFNQWHVKFHHIRYVPRALPIPRNPSASPHGGLRVYFASENDRRRCERESQGQCDNLHNLRDSMMKQFVGETNLGAGLRVDMLLSTGFEFARFFTQGWRDSIYAVDRSNLNYTIQTGKEPYRKEVQLLLLPASHDSSVYPVAEVVPIVGCLFRTSTWKRGTSSIAYTFLTSVKGFHNTPEIRVITQKNPCEGEQELIREILNRILEGTLLYGWKINNREMLHSLSYLLRRYKRPQVFLGTLPATKIEIAKNNPMAALQTINVFDLFTCVTRLTKHPTDCLSAVAKALDIPGTCCTHGDLVEVLKGKDLSRMRGHLDLVAAIYTKLGIYHKYTTWSQQYGMNPDQIANTRGKMKFLDGLLYRKLLIQSKLIHQYIPKQLSPERLGFDPRGGTQLLPPFTFIDGAGATIDFRSFYAQLFLNLRLDYHTVEVTTESEPGSESWTYPMGNGKSIRVSPSGGILQSSIRTMLERRQSATDSDQASAAKLWVNCLTGALDNENWMYRYPLLTHLVRRIGRQVFEIVARILRNTVYLPLERRVSLAEDVLEGTPHYIVELSAIHTDGVDVFLRSGDVPHQMKQSEAEVIFGSLIPFLEEKCQAFRPEGVRGAFPPLKLPLKLDRCYERILYFSNNDQLWKEFGDSEVRTKGTIFGVSGHICPNNRRLYSLATDSLMNTGLFPYSVQEKIVRETEMLERGLQTEMTEKMLSGFIMRRRATEKSMTSGAKLSPLVSLIRRYTKQIGSEPLSVGQEVAYVYGKEHAYSDGVWVPVAEFVKNSMCLDIDCYLFELRTALKKLQSITK